MRAADHTLVERCEGAAILAFEFTLPHAFSNVSIRTHAPSAPGVYGVSNARQWIYIGETDDIRERLLEHLTETSTRIRRYIPTGFTFEVCHSHNKAERHRRLVAQYSPVCNRESRLTAGKKA
jgi:excinuclease UvrABC nuclease subunit